MSARGTLDAHLLDVAPTVLDLLGLPVPGRHARPQPRGGAGARVNLIVYVSDALRTDHVGCYGARRVHTPTIDELAAGGVALRPGDRRRPVDVPVDDVDDQRPLPAPSRLPALGRARRSRRCRRSSRVAAAHGYATGSFVFDESYLFKGFPDANVAGTSETLDGAVAWLRAHRDEPFVLWFHSWATHMPYDVLHAERKEWLAAKTQIIDGIQSDSAAALEELRDAYAGAVERSSEVLLAGFLAELDALGLRDDTALAFLSDHGESWGERFADKQAVQGTYHMHGATLYDEIVEVPLILVGARAARARPSSARR